LEIATLDDPEVAMADGKMLTLIAFQAAGALGAYATGVLEYIYEA